MEGEDEDFGEPVHHLLSLSSDASPPGASPASQLQDNPQSAALSRLSGAFSGLEEEAPPSTMLHCSVEQW